MSTFYSMISRLENQGRLGYALDKAMLGMDIEEEKQEIEEARSLYELDVDRAERLMEEKSRARSGWGLAGTIIGGAASLINPALGPVASGLIGGVASALGRESVTPYTTQIQNRLPGGKFHMQARTDYNRDIMSTNEFIMDAAEGQTLLNLTSAFQDALNVGRFSMAYGDDNLLSGRPNTLEDSEDVALLDELDYSSIGVSRV